VTIHYADFHFTVNCKLVC